MRSEHLATDQQGRLLIDVRGPRFGAAITSVVLLTALVVRGPVGQALVIWQWSVFGVASIAGLAWSPYGTLFRFLKRRFDLGPPPATELEAAPRFAQACGLAVTSVAVVALWLGAPVVGWVAVGAVLALSLLLATTGRCIGCDLYLVGRRLTGGRGRHDFELEGNAEVAVERAVLDDRECAALGLDPAEPAVILLASPTCARCPAAAAVIAEVVAAATTPVGWAQVDAGEHLALTRRLRVLRVPTTLVIDPSGGIVARTSEVPAGPWLQAAIDTAAPGEPVAYTARAS